MNEIKNYFKSKKKAILSLMLAFVLMLSFNYSPILLLRDLVKADAYKSNTTQTYYSNSETTSESNVGSGEYPSSLADYFKNSSNNFNIQSYYNTRFSDLLAGHLDKFLKTVADIKVGPAGATDAEKTLYSELYREFLSKTGTYDGKTYDTLLEYYNAKSSTIKDTYGCSTFREFAEYFVSHDIEFQTNNTDNPTKTLYAFPNCVYTENSVEYKIQFYNVLANDITSNHLTINDQVEVKDENDEVIGTFRDGIADTEKFYEQSVSYNRVKDYIDAEIEKTIAIYTYDNETQNKNVAAILANGAPASKNYYYKDNTYETKIEETKKYVETGNTKNVYILMAKNSTIEGQVTAKGITTMQYNGNDIGEGVSDNDSLLTNFQKYPLLYRQVLPGEYGYLDNYITYYKYESIPYQTLSDGNYALYTVKDNPTADELATYNFLYVDLISSVDSSYVNVPLPNLSSITAYENIYFSTLFGINQTSTEGNTRFDNLANLFTTGGASNLYLKYKTTEKKVIYIQTGKKSEFEVSNQNYSYLSDIVEADFEHMSEAQLEEYYEIDGTKFSNYYVNGYTLYFKKIKENYQTLTGATYSSAYETKNVPNIPYEQDYYVTKSYEMDGTNPTERKIYVYLPDDETNNTTSYSSITQDTLDSARNNEYVKIPTSIITKNNMDTSYTYYYKHNISTDKKEVIYILVSDENYDKEKDNEVYKTLNYQVLKKSDYSYTQYVSVQKTDANYNENFSLYYKYNTDATIYVQNKVTNKNAIYVIDDSVTSSDKTTYKDNGRNFIPITTSEYESNYNFYTQITEDDDNYNLKYTLYYKYNSTDETERIVYIYSTSTSTEYETFSESTTDYLASDYELILPGDSNYVPGTNLYYKKIRNTDSEIYSTDETKTTYKYTTSSAVTLSANSYYVVSFYVYTNGTYNNSGSDVTKPMQASLYVEDSKEIIKNAYIENINTEGKWQKRYLFIATDSLSSSSIKLSLYMGNKESIIGSEYENYTTANGVVMFDDIKIIKINQTDYNNLSIDGKDVQTPPKSTDGEGSSSDPSTGPSITPDPEPATTTGSSVTFDYVDDYGNEIIATSISCKVNTSINIYDSTKTFNDMYDFDSMNESVFENLFNDAENVDGFTTPSKLWQMYISRDKSGQGNNYILKQYQKAYKEGKLSASIVEEKSFYNDKLDDDDDDDDNVIDTDSPETQADVAVVESTFNKNNKVLKLQNTSRQLDLGLISNYFVVEQSQYYKLTIWIYSPDEDATATLILSSILKTNSTQVNGSLLSSTANVNANIAEYTSSQNNEYGWIPISFYIEGNALHSQNCYLTLMANKNNTVYFDNISIEKITSSAYDTANSDSDKTTYCLSLAPSTSMLSTGVTNGYFTNVTVTDNYNDIDYTIPRTAESWTVSTKSNEVVAGVVAGSDEYLSHTETAPGYGNFYERYNNRQIPTNDLKYNLYAIYMPNQISNPLNEYGGKDSTKYDQAGIYKFYSSSISLSASTTYKLSFEFFKGYEFDGDVIANIYSSSVKDANLIESLSVNSSSLSDSVWNELSFYISTDNSSVTLYIELGVQNTSGTCFFKNISNVSQTKTIDKIRDEMILDSENVATPSGSDIIDLYNKNSFKFVKFVELDAFEFSVHGSEKDALSNTYENKEFANSLTATSDYTVGSSSVAVATYYTTYETVKYTVTIDKVEYYLKEVTDTTTGTKSYKLYSDSNYTDEITVLNGKKVTVDGTNKVIVGTENPTDYTITETKTTNYIYNFENDLVINNVFISADELKNEISENVIVLANSYSTDYTYIKPNYTTKLDASSYYVLKFYVKTSSFEDGFGLTIDLDSSISRKWTNIDTTDSKYDDLRDETYGFVCYQILISTGANAISTFSASFSLGSKESTGTGYAIIAGIELEKFASEKLFNEYSLNYDNIDKDSNDTIIKSYFGTTSSSSSTSDSSSTTDEDADDSKSSIWATFFYIFSSLLLGIALVLALVATIIKKHPIKVVQQEQNDHDKDSTFITTQSKKVNSEKEVTTQVETEEVVKKDDGFV